MNEVRCICEECGGNLARDVYGDQHEFVAGAEMEGVYAHDLCAHCGKSHEDAAHFDDTGHEVRDINNIIDRMDSRGDVRPAIDLTMCPHGPHRVRPKMLPERRG